MAAFRAVSTGRARRRGTAPGRKGSRKAMRGSGLAARKLMAYFLRSSYVRQADPVLRLLQGRTYKKGYEVRFVVASPAELREVRALVQRLGFRPGMPFSKHNRIVQPVYGRAAVDWFVTRLRKGRRQRSEGFYSDGARLWRRPRGWARRRASP